MKAAVVYEFGQPVQIKNLEQDPRKSGEVKVRMGAAGVCASDNHLRHGNAVLPLPVVLGHEGAGTVVEVGEGVRGLNVGDRCILSFVSNCGNCRTCRIGLPNICETNLETGSRQFDGTYRLHDQDSDVGQMGKLGVFAETIVIPQQACFPIPSSVPFDVAALIGCCVTTGVGSIINNPAARPGVTVAVFGCGGVGLNVIQGAVLVGASRIIAIDVVDHKLEFAYKFGATDVINSRDVNVVETIKDLTGDGVDIAVDSFGGVEVITDAVSALRRGGTAVMVGLVPVGAKAAVDVVDMIRAQKSLVGSYYGSASPHQTFEKLVNYYLSGRIDVGGLITREYQLDQLNEGFEAIEAGEDGRGVVVFGH